MSNYARNLIIPLFLSAILAGLAILAKIAFFPPEYQISENTFFSSIIGTFFVITTIEFATIFNDQLEGNSFLGSYQSFIIFFGLTESVMTIYELPKFTGSSFNWGKWIGMSIFMLFYLLATVGIKILISKLLSESQDKIEKN